MAIAAPLRLRVACEPKGRDFTPIYIVLIIGALIGIWIIMRRRKTDVQRYEEEMVSLKEKIKKAKGNK